MQRNYWPDWKKFLAQWGLMPLACVLLTGARPLIPFVGQMLILGVPLMNCTAKGDQYAALIETLGDQAAICQFSEYLGEGKV